MSGSRGKAMLEQGYPAQGLNPSVALAMHHAWHAGYVLYEL
jgi:hypothetical protein